MTKEALKMALEALEGVLDDAPKVLDASIAGGLYEVLQCRDAITAIKAALAQPEQEPVAWKLVPIEPTNEMLKAMDECSTEGYDERLPAGIASSVYMAAVEVAPKPPQQKINNEPKCVAIVEVFGKDWRLDYMALPVGKHKLYAQQYLYTTPPKREWVALTDKEKRSVCRVGPVYAPDGVVTRKPLEYRKELEGVALMAVRQAEAKLKEKNK